MSTLFPFLISYDGPDNASSMAHLLDAPAGRDGFVRVCGGRFATEAGSIRFHATNLTGPANFPSHEDADKLADRLARFGINCVRMHFFDAEYGNFLRAPEAGIIAERSDTQRHLDPGQIDRQDYLVAALKQRGIYTNMNLHVARWWDERDEFPDKNRRPVFDKGLDYFEPRMIDLQKEYARKLLGRVNPYTGVSYAEDPCIAMVEISNENSLFKVYGNGAIDRLPETYVSALKSGWNTWLQNKYRTTDALVEAWRWESVQLSDEQVTDGGFRQEIDFSGPAWRFDCGTEAAACARVDHGVLKIKVVAEDHDRYPRLYRNLSVLEGQPYTLSFSIRNPDAGQEVSLEVSVEDRARGKLFLGLQQRVGVTSEWKTFSLAFTATGSSTSADFRLSHFIPGEYEVRDVSFQSGAGSEFHPKADVLESGEIPLIQASGYAPLRVRRDFYQFLFDTEQRFWQEMDQYLKNELHIRVPVSGTQLDFSTPFHQAELDYVDNHSYWCHPWPVRKNWRIRNESMVNSMECIQWLAEQRVLGKPYTVSEYNHPFPNQYGAEAQPMLCAYGALQGWDGVFQYTYSNSSDVEPDYIDYFFSMIARTSVLAHFPACAAMYLRGDVREAESMAVGRVEYSTYIDRLMRGVRTVCARSGEYGASIGSGVIGKTAVELLYDDAGNPDREGVAEDAPIRLEHLSDTGELRWNTEMPGLGYFTVDTKNVKLFSGFPAGRRIELGGISLAIGPTCLGWATLSMVSRHANGFGESDTPANILLVATGVEKNTCSVVEHKSPTEIAFKDGTAWGHGPVLVEGIPTEIFFPVPAERMKCFALDPHGNRMKDVPVIRTENGSRIGIGPDYRTVWYEIEIV